jgi:hypothetical protein
MRLIVNRVHANRDEFKLNPEKGVVVIGGEGGVRDLAFAGSFRDVDGDA